MGTMLVLFQEQSSKSLFVRGHPSNYHKTRIIVDHSEDLICSTDKLWAQIKLSRYVHRTIEFCHICIKMA